MLDDGHLDVAYVMNIPMEDIPDVLARMGQTLDSSEMLDCFGSMRVSSLTVDCPDGLQVGNLLSDRKPLQAQMRGTVIVLFGQLLFDNYGALRGGWGVAGTLLSLYHQSELWK